MRHVHCRVGRGSSVQRLQERVRRRWPAGRPMLGSVCFVQDGRGGGMSGCLGGGQGRQRDLQANWKNIATFSRRRPRHLWRAGDLIDAWHLNEAPKQTKSTAKHLARENPSSVPRSQFVWLLRRLLLLLFFFPSTTFSWANSHYRELLWRVKAASSLSSGRLWQREQKDLAGTQCQKLFMNIAALKRPYFGKTLSFLLFSFLFFPRSSYTTVPPWRCS